MSSLKKYANKETIKTFLWLIVGVFVFTIAYKVYAKFFGGGVPEEEKLNPEEQATLNAMMNLPVNSSDLTISEAQADEIAKKFYEEMNPTFSYLNVDYLEDMLIPLTANDIRLVAKKFNVKPYQRYWWNATNYYKIKDYFNAVSNYHYNSEEDQARMDVFWNKANI